MSWDEDNVVGVVSLPADAPDKPYKAKRGSAWVAKVRVGTTTRDATREEEGRFYQQSGRLRYGMKPVLGAGIEVLDRRRLREYFGRVLGGAGPGGGGADEWRTLLSNLDLTTSSAGRPAPTIDGTLLFEAPGRAGNRLAESIGYRRSCGPGASAASAPPCRR